MINSCSGQNEVVLKANFLLLFSNFAEGNLKVRSFCSLFRITGAIHNSQDQGARRK